MRRGLERRDRGWLARVSIVDVQDWLVALDTGHNRLARAKDIASAIIILATRVAGAGMDARLSSRLPSLERWGSPFLELSRVADQFAEEFVRSSAAGGENRARDEALAVVEQCLAQVEALREQKKRVGTSLRLSSASLRMMQQLERLRLLIDCTDPNRRAGAIARLSVELGQEACRAHPATHFLRQKFDLIAYLMVGHAAQKGAKYAVFHAKDFRAFGLRSFLGGLIVAVFAIFKLRLSFEGLAPAPQALIYGANYAVCFVLISIFGATLATKQPALTASRLADAVAAPPDATPSFAEHVRAIWRSQFISFIGNVLGAGGFALVVAAAYQHGFGHPLFGPEEGQKLAAKLHPWESGTMFFAAVAGVMLSLAGFVAGSVDNAMVFYGVGERVRAGRGVFTLVPGARLREELAQRIDSGLGAIVGNIALGFMLGAA
ncbi:MAG: hypothetical protein AAGA56_23340, partial [Myxococcota bacterium]